MNKLKIIIAILDGLLLLSGCEYYLIKGCPLTFWHGLLLVVTFILSLVYLFDKNNKIFKKDGLYLSLLLLTLLLGNLLLFPYLSGAKTFYFNSDTYLQYDYFYAEWQRMWDKFSTEGTFPFYSFSSFLGNDFFTSKLYYVVGDIFFIFRGLFDSQTTFLMYESFLLIILSSLFLAFYFKHFGIKNHNVIITSALLYAFGGLVSLYLGQYMFHRFYAFLPLLLAGVEIYRQNKKITVFALATALLLLFSYYFMFPTAIFLVVYYIFTRKYHDDLSFLKIIKSAFKLVGGFLIGFMVVGIVLIPGALYILHNPRVGSLNNLSLFYEPQVYVGYIFNFLTGPVTLWTEYPYPFASGYDGHLTWYTVYLSVITAPLVLSIFSGKCELKGLKALRFFLGIMLISPLIPIISSVVHGFSEPSFRWCFLIVISCLLTMALVLDDFDKTKDILKDGLIIYGACLVIATIIALLNGIFDLSEHRIYLGYVFLAFMLMIICYCLLRNDKKDWLLCLCVIETFSVTATHLSLLNTGYQVYDDSLSRDTLQYINDEDEDRFFRMYVDYHQIAPYTDELNLNQSLNYGYHSFQTYDSTYETNLNPFLNALGINWHIIDIKDPEVLRMLGLKYYYVIDESELPAGYEWEYVLNNNHFQVYELKDHRPLGFTYSVFGEDLSTIADEGKWNEILYLPTETYALCRDINPAESADFVITDYFDDNNISGYVELNDKQVLFLSIPYNKGWRIYDNDQAVTTYPVQGGFTGIILDQGYHAIRLNYMPPGLKLGALCSALGIVAFAGILIIENKKKKPE